MLADLIEIFKSLKISFQKLLIKLTHISLVKGKLFIEEKEFNLIIVL
jgi:hypothetical protein